MPWILTEQVQMVHNGFRSFADKIGEIYNLRKTEYQVIRDIGLSFRNRGVLSAPIEIEIKPTDIPLWVQTEKFRQLIDLETQKNGIKENIDFYSKFLPLLYLILFLHSIKNCIILLYICLHILENSLLPIKLVTIMFERKNERLRSCG